jgi:hypothetical protein
MDRDEALRLRADIKSGRRHLRQLSGDEFQMMMYWLLVESIVSPTHRVTLSNQYRGEVDFVALEHLTPLPSGVSLGRSERTHFFECKRYGRPFELADVSKLFCAAIRHHPETVALVSTGPLQQQAQDYANLFFGRGGRFPSIEFQNLRAEVLLGMPLPPDSTRKGARDTLSSSHQLDWRLVEHGAFYDRVIASGDTAPTQLTLSVDRDYTLEVSGTSELVVTKRAALQIDLFLPGTNALPFSRDSQPRFSGHQFRATFNVDAASLASAASKTLALHFGESPSRQKVVTFTLPKIDVIAGTETPLQDLRGEVSHSVSRDLASGDVVLTFVNGKAGVGKSYLCSKVAKILKAEFGYAVENFRADSVVDGSVFVRMLVRLLTPPLQRDNLERDGELGSKLMAEAVRCLLGTQRSAESEPLVEALARGGSVDTRLDMIVPLLAALLLRSGNVVLILQDCHDLPSTLISALDALIVALDERGWAGTRFILEYRTAPGSDNPTWAAFVRRVQSTLHSRSRTESISNLSRDDVEAGLRPLFEAVTPDMIAAIWSHTGGNPLLLTNLLRGFLEAGVVERSASGKLRVRYPARVLEVHTPVADKPRIVLENRMAQLDSRMRANGGELPSFIPFLAILALTEGLLPLQTVFAYFGVTIGDGSKLVRWLVREEVLLLSTGDTPCFAHDWYRDTAMELGKEDENTLRVAERILDETVPDGYVAILRMAALARYVGDLRLAREYLNIGHEAAKNDNQFGWSRRFQIHLLDVLKSLPSPSDRDRLAQLGLLNDLGWSEHNTGSNWASREYFREGRRVADALPTRGGEWTTQLRRSTLAHLDHRIMTVDLELLDFEGSVESAEHALGRVRDPSVLGRIINRLILCCSHLGFVDAGIYFSRAGVDLAELSQDPEVDAVLCTDIGSLTSLALGDVALSLFERGVGLASSARQRLQNEYALITHRLSATGQIEAESERVRFSARLGALGMTILQGAFDNYEGVVQLLDGNLGDACRLFAQAEIHARLYEQLGLEAAVWNNAMIAALLDDDVLSARINATRLSHFWLRLIRQRTLLEPRLPGLIRAFENARSRMETPTGSPRLTIEAAPAFTGSYLTSLVNLAALSAVEFSGGGNGFDPGSVLSAWVGETPNFQLSTCAAVVRRWRGVPLYLDP